MCIGLKELGGVERKTKGELAEGMDEAYLSCVNVRKYLSKDVCLLWVIIGMCSAGERSQRVKKKTKLEIGQQSDSMFSYCKGHRGMRQLIA